MRIRFVEEAAAIAGTDAGKIFEVSAPPLVGQNISNPIIGTVITVQKGDSSVGGVEYLVVVRKA